MYLKRVELKNFRNYSCLKISFNKGINILYGNNAQGKTNLLESIYTLGLTDTFRNVSNQDMIQKNKNYFQIDGILKKETLDTKMQLKYIDNKKIPEAKQLYPITFILLFFSSMISDINRIAIMIKPI